MDADFVVRIWGARGSLPSPAAANCEFGSDTCCVEVRCGARVLVFDAGTGAASLGSRLLAEGISEFDLFLTHCHFDHIIGLPFMRPLYCAGVTVRIHAGHLLDGTSCRELVEDFMCPPYFPVTPLHFKADVSYCDFRPPEILKPHPGIEVRTVRLNHPGGAVGYRVDFGGRSVCYITDTEHAPGARDEAIVSMIRDSDLVIYDATYTDEEFESFRDFGHSTWQEGVRLCETAGARRLVVFHHRLERDDAALRSIESDAQRAFPGAIVARTGLELRPGEEPG